MSEESVSAIEAILTLDPNSRPNGADVRKMPLFKHINWENLLNTEAPFIPQPDSSTDTCYFQGKPVFWYFEYQNLFNAYSSPNF